MGRRFAWKAVFVLAALATGVALSYRPWSVYLQHRERADHRLAEMREAEAQRVELTERRARLDTKTGREETARGYGFRKPGEVPPEELK